MERSKSGRRIALVLGACVAVGVAGTCPARAFVLESTPTLPLLDFPYYISGGACFSNVSVCVTGGEFTLTSVVSNMFPAAGQYRNDEVITADATDMISLNPVATVTMTGTVEQVVVGRLNAFDTGIWTADLISVSLSGSLNGYPITLTLNPAKLSSDTGTTSIEQDGAFFSANSFFDVFAEVTYDGPTGVLTATPSGTASVTAPEPVSFVLLGGPLLALSAVRRRRR